MALLVESYDYIMSATDYPNDAAPVPNETERKRIFFWLKQISSYTAWNRLLGFYRAWADAAEHIKRLAREHGAQHSSTLHESDYHLIFNGLAHCEEGVHRLSGGDKQVFRFTANGEFALAERALGYWDKYLWRMEMGEHPPINEKSTPGWDRFHSTVRDLIEVWREISPDILEPRHIRTDSHTFFNDFLRLMLEQLPLPDPIPPVPDPEISILVRSGRLIPCSGVWEPVDSLKPKLLSLLRRKEPLDGPLPIAGTMSYLHGGSTAPNMAAYAEENGLPTTWRLLWEDNRYTDNSIPSEEESYVFLAPAKAQNQNCMKQPRESLACVDNPKASIFMMEGERFFAQMDVLSRAAIF